MSKIMLINVSQGEECRIALVEDDKLEELYMERSSSTSHVGNIYKGRVTNVEPSIQAAFVDFGLGRNGFLHISDLMPSYFGQSNGEIQETVGRKMARRDRPPIQRCLRRGDEIIVQIIKEGIGTKGPTLSTYLSIPGRILVMMPGMARMGVSRKIEDELERRRLRQILDSLKPPKDVGFIIRTAGIGKTKTEIQRDLTYLTRLWVTFVKKRDSGAAPLELYTEGDLVTRTVRDVFSSDIDRLIVDDKEVAKRVKEVIKLANPRTRNKVELDDGAVPLFHKYGIEREIEQMYSRHVPLPSGGSLVIDSTEAIVAIDVNSGRFRDHSDAETTAFKTDIEAADEIPRQLRLRDLGGVIICDFIDLRYERHRRELEGRLHANFQKDRAKTKVLRMSQFGIIELTRQRMRPSLKRSIYFDCPHCKGAGLIKTPESMSLDVMRRLAIAINDARVARVELTVCPDATFYLQNRKRAQIAELEQKYAKRVIVRADPLIGLDEMKLELFDARDGLVYLEELGMSPTAETDQRQGGRRFEPGRGRRERHRGPRPRVPVAAISRAAPAEPAEEDRFDNAEEEVERREEDLETEETSPLEPAAESAAAEAPPAPDQARAGPVGEAEVGLGGGHRRRRRGRRGRGRGRGAFEPAGQPPRPSTPQAQSPSGEWAELEPQEQEVFPESQHADQVELSEPAGQAALPQAVRSHHRRREPPTATTQPPFAEERPAGAAAPGRRRRRRGGRRHRRGGGAPGEGRRASESPPAVRIPPQAAGAGPVKPSAGAAPPDNAPRAAEAATLTRTGSADRHLVQDEPVAPQPVHRPKTYRDLDSIPDEFD
ncbi:MAG: Rne/Rng family ribonuclease [Tepidisphaeraceae bacterium]